MKFNKTIAALALSGVLVSGTALAEPKMDASTIIVSTKSIPNAETLVPVILGTVMLMMLIGATGPGGSILCKAALKTLAC